MCPWIRLLHHAVAAIIVLLSAATGGRAADRKHNFVFVYSDDHRWDAMGVGQKKPVTSTRLTYPFTLTVRNAHRRGTL